MGFSYDLRVVPLILSFIYFGRIAGWITLISIIVMRIFYTGGYWEPPVIAYLGMGILFSTFKTYFKNYILLKVHRYIFLFYWNKVVSWRII